MVSIAIGGLQTENLGDRSKITPKLIANQVMEDNNIENITAQGNTFPTYIIFEDDGVKVGVNVDLSIGEFGSYNGIYSEKGLEGKIAPEDLFEYEIINDGAIGATGMDSLSERTVKITGIRREYCNANSGDSNYEIKYDNDVIVKEGVLVVPYEVDGENILNGIQGEKYTVTEVSLKINSGDTWGHGHFPNVKTIIYPNTVEKLYADGDANGSGYNTTTVERIVLTNSLKEINGSVFDACSYLKNIVYNGVEYTSESKFKEALTSYGVKYNEDYLFGYFGTGLSD